jgi:hypothetical protein
MQGLLMFQRLIEKIELVIEDIEHLSNLLFVLKDLQLLVFDNLHFQFP